MLKHECLSILFLVEDYTHSSCVVDYFALLGVPEVVASIMTTVAVDILEIEGSVWSLTVPSSLGRSCGVAWTSHCLDRSLPWLRCCGLASNSWSLLLLEAAILVEFDLKVDAILCTCSLLILEAFRDSDLILEVGIVKWLAGGSQIYT